MNRIATLLAYCLVLSLGTFLVFGAEDEFAPKPPIPYRSVADEQKSFVLPPGYRMEIVLDENSIKEPVVCVFDGNGRMYVAEFRSYMQDIDATKELTPIGLVSRHESTKGDGVYDKHSVYASGLLLPREVLPLDDRVLINETNTNDINVYRDTKGDGVADKKELWYAGGARGGNLEHQQSGLVWAMDNWMYQAVNAYRLRINGKDILKEGTPGNGGQWGCNQDDYGKMWFVQGGGEIGPIKIQMPIIYGGYDLPDQEPADYKEVWPLVGLADVQGGYGRFRLDNKTLNHFTATCGIEVVRTDRLPEDMRGDLLFCEPVGRLIRRSKIENKEGMTFIHNIYDKNEFLLSTDPNFRPINICNAPDGSIYIVDMYRGIIQEGNWTKPGSYLRKVIVQHGLDKNAGKGRIWRLTHNDFKPGPQPHMLDETPAQLVAHLDNPSGWWRDTAQKLLVLKGDKSVVPALVQMARTDKNHLARIHALWTLEGLNALEKDVILDALKDSHPQVRIAGIRTSEALIKKGDAALDAIVQGMTKDSDPNVFLQVLYTNKLLNKPDFTKSTQVALAQTKFDGAKKVGALLLGGGPTFDNKIFNKNEIAHMQRGGEIFRELCYACHGFDGKGMPREAAGPGIVLNPAAVKAGGPPLSTTLAPTLSGSSTVHDRDAILRVLLSGLSGPIHNKTYDAQMVAMNSNDDEWVSDVASFVRNSFGNHGPAVNWMDSARIRTESANRHQPWTPEELEALKPQQVPHQEKWKLSASHNTAGVGACIDGDPETRWDTHTPQVPGMWFQIEFPEETEVQSIALQYGKSSGDYPRGYTVETSSDGKKWSKPIVTGKGTPGATEIDLLVVKTKFIRINQTGSAPGTFWSIHEMQIYPPRQKKAAVAAKASKKILAVSVTLNDRAPSINNAEKLLAEMAERVGTFSVDFVKQPGGRMAEAQPPKREAKDSDETFRVKADKYKALEEGRKASDDKWLENATKLLADKLSPANLKNYDGVIFLNTSGDLPLPDKQAFVDWVKSGKAFIGVHAAADTLHGFKPYAEMLGGEADGHPWDENVTVRVIDRKSTMAMSFVTRFEIADEIFQFKNWDAANVRTLLALDPSNDNHAKVNDKAFFDRGARADKNYALAWTRDFGQGRVFYTGLGKSDEVWKNEKFQQHVLAGIDWALGLIPAERTLEK